jgi:hypothetical protein
MSKLTQIQRQQLKDLVIDAAVRRLTNLEMTDYIQSQMQITISQDYLKHVKSSIRKEAFQQLQVYRADQMSYLTEIFLEPASELKLMKKTLHQIIENEEEDTEARIKAIAQLQNVNSQMIGYYQYLPQVMKAVGGEVMVIFIIKILPLLTILLAFLQLIIVIICLLDIGGVQEIVMLSIGMNLATIAESTP